MCDIACKKTIINSLMDSGMNAQHMTAFNALDATTLDKVQQKHPGLLEELAESALKTELLSSMVVAECRDYSGESKNRSEIIEKMIEQVQKVKKKSFLGKILQSFLE